MNKPRGLNKEDIEFLNNLQLKMNTQNHCGQASPRYWTVMEKCKEWGIAEDYADDCCICDEDGNEYYSETLEGTLKLLSEDYEIGDYKVLSNGTVELTDEDYTCDIWSLQDITEYIDEKFNKGLNVCYFKNNERVVPNTMFLTLEECQKHIKSNHYHYNEGRPYSMTAWRSNEVAKLYDILENIVWEEQIKEEL